MRRVCASPLCPKLAIAGRSRCSTHGPTAPAGPSPYGHRHQQMARVAIQEAQGVCAMAHLGGCAGPLQGDHILPHSMGGTWTQDNYQALCRHHNISKGGVNRL